MTDQLIISPGSTGADTLDHNQSAWKETLPISSVYSQINALSNSLALHGQFSQESQKKQTKKNLRVPLRRTGLWDLKIIGEAYDTKVKRRKITRAHDIFDHIKNVVDWNELSQRESFYVFYLTRNNTVYGYTEISFGGRSGTIVDLSILFQNVLEFQACGIILCHNHPSGNLKPSEQDLKLTKNIKEIGNRLQILLLDHLIITYDHDLIEETPYRFFSLAEEGLL